MWVFATFGILMPAIRPPATVAKDDPKTLQIRSRRAKDLDILRAKYMLGTLGATIHTPQLDYEYRAYCEPQHFSEALSKMVLDIDWKKFKPETIDKYADEDLHRFYNAVWGVMFSAFSEKKVNLLGVSPEFSGDVVRDIRATSSSLEESSDDKLARLLQGTEYENPDFEGYASYDYLGMDDLEGLLDDEEDDVDAPYIVSVRDFAECVGSAAKRVRRFIRSLPDSHRYRGAGGRYEIGVDDIDELARKFFEWEDSLEKNNAKSD